MKFHVKYLLEFQVTVEAANAKAAEAAVRPTLDRTPGAKLLSILPEGYVEPTEPTTPHSPRGRPNGGGSPGTPTARLPEALVDQIAKAA